MSSSLQHDKFLAHLREQAISVSVFLINGIQLTGTILQFDDSSLFLDGPKQQMVYRHAVATIVPKTPMAFDF